MIKQDKYTMLERKINQQYTRQLRLSTRGFKKCLPYSTTFSSIDKQQKLEEIIPEQYDRQEILKNQSLKNKLFLEKLSSMGVKKRGASEEEKKREIQMIRICLRNLELACGEEDKVLIEEIRSQLEMLQDKSSKSQTTFC